MTPRERAEETAAAAMGLAFDPNGGLDLVLVGVYLTAWRAALEAALEKERKVSMGVCGGGGPLNQPHPTYIRPADIRALLETEKP